MASKKKTKKKLAKKSKRAARIKHRACTVCRKLGHNKRSHEPGGKLA